MKNHMNLGPTPVDEPCVALSEPDYETLAAMECTRFIKLIRATLGQEPAGSLLMIHSMNHDYGAYQEVALFYDDEDKDHRRYAQRCETDLPETW